MVAKLFSWQLNKLYIMQLVGASSVRCLSRLVLFVAVGTWTPSLMLATSTELTTAHDASHLKLGLEWYANPDHLPLIIANLTGIFAALHLTVDIREPAVNHTAWEQIQNGELDLAVTETVHLLEQRISGKPIVGFGRLLDTDCGVMFRRGEGIERPRDMCEQRSGRKTRINYPGARASQGLDIIRAMAEADGAQCDMESDMEVVGDDSAGRIDILQTMAQFPEALGRDGAADVDTLSFRNFELTQARHLGMNVSFHSLRQWGIPDLCQLVFMTSRESFLAKAVAIQKFSTALQEAMDWITANRDRARAFYYEWARQRGDFRMHSSTTVLQERSADPMMDSIINETIGMFPSDQALPAHHLEELHQWMAKTGLLTGNVNDGTLDYWSSVAIV